MAKKPKHWHRVPRGVRDKVIAQMKGAQSRYEEFGTCYYASDANEMLAAWESAIAFLTPKKKR